MNKIHAFSVHKFEIGDNTRDPTLFRGLRIANHMPGSTAMTEPTTQQTNPSTTQEQHC